MKWSIYLSMAILCLASLTQCNSNEEKQQAAKNEKKKDFLPVIEFVAGELKHVDTVPYTLIKYTTVNEHTDSSFINRKDLKNMTNEFLEISIRDEKYQEYYDETSFVDNSTGTASFTYISNSPKVKLSRVDAYVNPETQKISRVYLERNYSAGDTAITKKLLWQTAGNFIIITIKNFNNQETTVQEKIVWDEKPEE